MAVESSVTSVSWIPSEAITGPMRLPMDLGVGRYDEPPPDHIDDFAQLVAADGCRFVNRLSAWVDVADGVIVDHGYSGSGIVGSTTMRLGIGSLTVPGVGYPLLQSPPEVVGDGVRFTQTAGGRTGAPLPRRTTKPPYLRITAPTAWTTLSLTIRADGTTSAELTGASPFPRHWVYGADGTLIAKSGLIDFDEWAREHSHDNTPWNDADRVAIVAQVESKLERQLSRRAMSGTKPRFRSVDPGDDLVRQGDAGQELFLILDGMLEVDVDGKVVAEIGPGALVGERAVLDGGVRTSTLTALTPTRVAVLAATMFTDSELTEIAEGHRHEDE